MSEHVHGGSPAIITITIPQADGGAISRGWLTCGDCAELVAAHLGPPTTESLMTREAVKAAQRVPGIVFTDGETS